VSADELQALYDEVIRDHARTPRNFRVPEDARKGEAHNRMCGDRFEVYVRLAGETIADVGFQGTGCAISIASASLMTERVKGIPVADAVALFDRLRQMLATPPGTCVDGPEALIALGSVRLFPTRIRCATLAWEALRDALRAQPASR
jgi:nitrogen fixation NifU-like protein